MPAQPYCQRCKLIPETNGHATATLAEGATEKGKEWGAEKLVFIIHDSGMVAAGGHVAHVVLSNSKCT